MFERRRWEDNLPPIFDDLPSSPRYRTNMHESYAYIYVNMHIANCHMVLGVNILAILLARSEA